MNGPLLMTVIYAPTMLAEAANDPIPVSASRCCWLWDEIKPEWRREYVEGVVPAIP